MCSIDRDITFLPFYGMIEDTPAAMPQVNCAYAAMNSRQLPMFPRL